MQTLPPLDYHMPLPGPVSLTWKAQPCLRNPGLVGAPVYLIWPYITGQGMILHFLYILSRTCHHVSELCSGAPLFILSSPLLVPSNYISVEMSVLIALLWNPACTAVLISIFLCRGRKWWWQPHKPQEHPGIYLASRASQPHPGSSLGRQIDRISFLHNSSRGLCLKGRQAEQNWNAEENRVEG